MNWLLVIVGITLLIGAVNGYCKGAIRILVSLVTTLVTIAIVLFATPYVSQAVVALTPFDEIIESTCRKSIVKMAESSTELLEQYQLNESDQINIEEIEELELPRNLQISLIENAKFPDLFKELLISNNNSEVYEMLGAMNFVDYISKYMTKLIIEIMSFLITFLIVTIVVRAIVFALDFVAELPVLGLLNRLSGAGVGLMLSLIIVWFSFIIITLLYETTVGDMLLQMIAEDRWLSILYKLNPIMQMLTTLR